MKALDESDLPSDQNTDIIAAEEDASTQGVWEVWRRDDNNNEFRISRHLTQSAAQARADHFESLGHKQDYWVQPRHP